MSTNSLQEKIKKFSLLSEKGINFNESLRNNQQFKNPSIIAKLIEMIKVDEFGSNYDKSVFNPNLKFIEGFYIFY